jgi:hypothetical protein
LICWAFGIALVARTSREQLALTAAAAAASVTNVFVYPYTLPPFDWQLCSTVLFGLSIAITAYLLHAALIHGPGAAPRAGRSRRAAAG